MDFDCVKMGFPPVCDENSRVLILGSFPSVKSREVSFYYGNKQNRFWKMLFGVFDVPLTESIDEKREFLLRHRIARWDIATECKIKGSSDSSLTEPKIADLSPILEKAKVDRILLNGTLAYDLFCTRYAKIGIPYYKLPSTSPANPRYKEEPWRELLYDLR